MEFSKGIEKSEFISSLPLETKKNEEKKNSFFDSLPFASENFSSTHNFSASSLPQGNTQVFEAIKFFLLGGKCSQEFMQNAVFQLYQKSLKKYRENLEKKKRAHYYTKTEIKISLIDDWFGKK